MVNAIKTNTFAVPTTTTTRRPSYVTVPTTKFTTPNAGIPSPSTTISTVTQRPNGNKPSKDCEHGQYYAYPNSCTHFLVCVNGKLVRQQCGPGLNWNEPKNMCDWAFKNPCNDSKKNKPAKITQKDEAQVCFAIVFFGAHLVCEQCLIRNHCFQSHCDQFFVSFEMKRQNFIFS